ncbi:hypothetical protein BJY01DRAFT_225156 [Aspergillus pseudoustus]|uniref:F-box domain-containing protein n=1 Tax=Aspergillus pseudoustus TaxID=1810923 RepID=A0ABR4J0F8_9EURO
MVAEYNVYCALCSCCLGNSCELGSRSPRHMRIRRARVARRTYARSTGDQYYETEDESEEEKETRLKSMPWLREAAEADDGLDTASLADARDDPSFDPDVLSRWGLDWLDDVVALGIADWKTSQKSYFIRECAYDDRNVVYLNEDDDTDEDDADDRYFAYGVSDLPDPPVYPMHRACLDLLSRAIFGVVDVERIEKNVLYDVLHELSDFRYLSLDYGDITGPDQDWICVPGEEYSVTCPTDQLDLSEQLLRAKLALRQSTGTAQTPPPDLAGKVLHDPFRDLPYDITYQILQNLPGESVLALNKTSWTMLARTDNHSFWKRRLAQDMPWLLELPAYLEEDQEQQEQRGERRNYNINYKLLYMWLDKRTEPAYGMSGEFMGVANRRRIWGPCVEIAERYHRVLDKTREI